MILSDWGITGHCCVNCKTAGVPHTFADIAMPWGVESLSVADRFARGINAGLDQIGGVEDTPTLVGAVRAGAVSEARLDESVRRLLTQKFQLGLFENPFANATQAAEVIGQQTFKDEAGAAQRRSLVLLENRSGAIPLKPGARVYLHNIAGASALQHGLTPVDRFEDAEVAVLRLFWRRSRSCIRTSFSAGCITKDAWTIATAIPTTNRSSSASERVPTIVTVYLDRPAILTNVRDKVQALIANFGVDDEALLDVLTGRAKAEGGCPSDYPPLWA